MNDHASYDCEKIGAMTVRLQEKKLRVFLMEKLDKKIMSQVAAS